MVNQLGTRNPEPGTPIAPVADAKETDFGIPIPGNVQIFVGPQWGGVRPFAVDFASLLPGPPPRLHDPATDAAFKQAALDVGPEGLSIRTEGEMAFKCEKKSSFKHGDDNHILVEKNHAMEVKQDTHIKGTGAVVIESTTAITLKVGGITLLEPNTHAGVKYMRQVLDANFKDEPMDTLNRGLFTFASYNAGPGRVRQLRREAAKRGLDPNVWFGNVEQIASERIGRETVTYVSNIDKYYVAYRLVVEENERRAAAKAALKGDTTK